MSQLNLVNNHIVSQCRRIGRGSRNGCTAGNLCAAWRRREAGGSLGLLAAGSRSSGRLSPGVKMERDTQHLPLASTYVCMVLAPLPSVHSHTVGHARRQKTRHFSKRRAHLSADITQCFAEGSTYLGREECRLIW